MDKASLRVAFALAVALVACTSPAANTTAEDQPKTKTSPQVPWTQEFQQKSILIANEISIEGPPGLRDHLALKQYPDQKYAAKTTEDGFLQEVSAGETSANPIWIQIDNLAINAVRQARILERISDGPVRIRARGEVLWKNLETGQEHSAEAFELTGARPK